MRRPGTDGWTMGYHVGAVRPARAARARVAVGGPAALPLSTVPDKRQDSKQRRAARNRANREALAARRENAVISDVPTGKTSGDAPKAAKAGAARGRAGRAASGAAGASATSTGTPTGTSTASPTSGKRPGEIFLWIAFGLAIAGTLAMLFILKAPVDDRGEPIPGGANAFGGLTMAAREAVTGEPLPDDSITYLDAYGVSAVVSAALPLSLTAFALWASRRRADRSRMLTYAMLGMAVAIFLGGGLFVFFPALIFLAIGGFIARRADLPARVAERATGTGGGLFGRRGPVIDADSGEVVEDDEPGPAEGDPDEAPAQEAAGGRARRKRRRGAAAAGSEAATDDAGSEADAAQADAADAGADAVTGDSTDAGGDAPDADPLAELEAELEAERAAEAAARSEQADEADGGGTRR
jgi:hypothetical protein